MSLAGSSERIGFLRQTLARIEAQAFPVQVSPAAAAQALWRAHKPDRIALGSENFSLDRVLGGGLQIGALHDIVAADPRESRVREGGVRQWGPRAVFQPQRDSVRA